MHRSALPRPDLLRAFEAAARLASFTRAANELAPTPSAMSRQVQLLEGGEEAVRLLPRRLLAPQVARLLLPGPVLGLLAMRGLARG